MTHTVTPYEGSTQDIARLRQLVEAAFPTRREFARAMGFVPGRATNLLGGKDKPPKSSPSWATVRRVLAAVNAKTGQALTLADLEAPCIS